MTARMTFGLVVLSSSLVSCSAPGSASPQVVTRHTLGSDAGRIPRRSFYNAAQPDAALAGDVDDTDGGPDCTPAITPGGLRPSACIHEVPNGGMVEAPDAGIVIIRDAVGRVVARFPEICPCYRDAGR